MRDRRYIAVHRGGPLLLEHHRLLALWSAQCVEHVLPLFTELCPDDQHVQQAILIARAWARGEVPVGAAQAASVAAHAAAREAPEGPARFVARAAGQAVATAHMADHSPGGAVYALKAIKAATARPQQQAAMQQEFQWQTEQLPPEIRELMLSTIATKFASLGLFMPSEG